MKQPNSDWWKKAVAYQIYIRSFQDSNGDGVGDIPGILPHLDELKELGVDVLWLSPFCTSPNDDNGYDVSDYYSIQPEYGTMADLEELIDEAQKRNMTIMMDLVFNHTSDEHPWFKESRSSTNNPKRDWYLWAAPNNGKEPNNWDSFFGGKAWEFDPQTQEFYCHIFSKKQPDLNWANPAVRNELKKISLFWIKKGIRAFRLDAIHLIGKPLDLRDFPSNTKKSFKVWENTQLTHTYLQEFHAEVFEPYGIFTVGETGGTTPQTARLYTNSDRKELSTIFHFDHVHLRDNHERHSLFKNWESWQRGLSKKAWDAPFLSNHDLARSVSAYGEEGVWRIRSAQALGGLLLTSWGTPFIYQGEEYGIPNAYFDERQSYRDQHSAYLVDQFLKHGYVPDEVWNSWRSYTRDNSRVPISWSSQPKAGFTTGSPWMPLHPQYQQVNAHSDRNAEVSVFRFFQELIRLRKKNQVLIFGDYRVLTKDGPIGVISRRMRTGESALVVMNLCSNALTQNMKHLGRKQDYSKLKLRLSNYLPDKRIAAVLHPFYKPRSELGAAVTEELYLRPWEFRIYL